MSLWLCFLPRLSLSHALTAATWFMKVPILWDEGWKGGRTVCAGQSSGITMDELCCYINIYSSPSPSPPFFCCFYHFHRGPISNRKSWAVHLVRYHRFCVVTSGCRDSHRLCILCQTIPVLSTLFQAGRQVFRCRSGIELPAAHSVSIFWPCYMYSKWLFIVTSIFKTRFCLLELKVLHNLVRKSFWVFCWNYVS